MKTTLLSITVKNKNKLLFNLQNLEKASKKNKPLQNEILSLYSEEEASESSKDVVNRVQLGIFDKLMLKVLKT